MYSKFIQFEILKFSFILSIVFFLSQNLTFYDALAANTKSLVSTNESNLGNIIEKDFTKVNSNTSANQTQTLHEKKIKIVAAGDFGCRPIAQNNIKQIELQKPDIFLVLGDLSYKPSMDCWYKMTKTLDSKIKIAIGNHEEDEEEAQGGSKELRNSLLKHYDLQNSYYSFDYGNVHFLVLDTQLEFSLDVFEPKEEEEKEENDDNNKDDESNKANVKYYATTLKDLLAKYSIKGIIPPYHLLNDEVIVEDIPRDTEQYKFVVNDLENTNNNSSINWIIVMFHKPFYSSLSSHIQEYIMREKYQPVFDKYGVDIVLQGHNHIYDRTLPLKFNPNNIGKPIVDESNNTNEFFNPDGSIYSVIGLGGRSSSIILNHPDYVVKQYNGFGFLSIEINGKELDAKYYDIGYKCKEKNLKEDDLEEGDFTIYEMSSCNDKNTLKIIDHYIISKVI